MKIMITPCALLLGGSLLFAGLLSAAGFEGGRPTHPLFMAGSGYYALLNTDGSVLRRWNGGNTTDGWLMPNGHMLAADSGVWETDAAGKRVWGYASKDTTGGATFAAQRLPNGNTLIGENSTGRILEVTPNGETVNVIEVPLNKANRHQTLRMVRRYPDGVTLVCRSGFNMVEVYGPDRTLQRTLKVPGLAFAALRAPDGSIYVTSLNKITRFAPDGNVLWVFDACKSGRPIVNMTLMHLLPNGNLIVGCYGYNPQKQIGIFEVTPDKKILWAYRTPNRGRDSHMSVQLMDPAINNLLR